MKKIFLPFILLYVGISLSKGQNTTESFQTPDSASIEGTYQIQVINSRSQPYIPANIAQLVINNRNSTLVTYVNLGTEVRLKILPLSEVNTPDFKPLEKISHITE